ncbi:hypothetical protein [Chryseobacterium sp. T16E-39]|uniref:hypothetical protein n=1 Tax=Chryseobacterium sp. T16E-39 TaxID=2015076 RepID=UPI0012FCFBAB|nr:hypothetical protein [Chryseobacterium sp. T16E-39]
MTRFTIVASGILGCILLSCGSTFSYPSKFSNICFYIDTPTNELYIKTRNRFVLTYPNSFEKIMGIWKIKKDTLQLSTLSNGSLLDKDSIPYKEEMYLIIRGTKLINPKNKKCFMQLQK